MVGRHLQGRGHRRRRTPRPDRGPLGRGVGEGDRIVNQVKDNRVNGWLKALHFNQVITFKAQINFLLHGEINQLLHTVQCHIIQAKPGIGFNQA